MIIVDLTLANTLLRKILRVLSCVAVSILVCTALHRTTSAQVVLKLAHGSAPSPELPISRAATWFQQELETKSAGRIKVQIFPSKQLGEEADQMNGLKIGNVDATYISTAPMTAAVPEIDLLSLPFLFKSVDQAIRAAEGGIGDYFNPKINEAVGAKVPCWSSLGERDVWNSKHPVRTLADMKGLKIRTQQSRIQIDTYAALGAQPTPMAYGELYTALQTGVVDGADNGPVDLELDKFYQVTKYVTFTRHVYVLLPMLVSTKFLSKLSPEDQKLVLDVAGQSCKIITDTTKEQDAHYIENLKSQGLEFSDLSENDRKAFLDAVQSVYAKNAEKVGGMALIQKAMNTP